MQPLNTHGNSFILSLLAIASGNPEMIEVMQPHMDTLPSWMVETMFESAENLRKEQEAKSEDDES
jgi:hypothetical protein